jgi:hypothetical protein
MTVPPPSILGDKGCGGVQSVSRVAIVGLWRALAKPPRPSAVKEALREISARLSAVCSEKVLHGSIEVVRRNGHSGFSLYKLSVTFWQAPRRFTALINRPAGLPPPHHSAKQQHPSTGGDALLFEVDLGAGTCDDSSLVLQRTRWNPYDREQIA